MEQATADSVNNAPTSIATLDGARGVATISVLISHSANLGMLPSILGNGLGKVGVLLFFVLSGFLMAYLYAHTPLTKKTLKTT